MVMKMVKLMVMKKERMILMKLNVKKDRLMEMKIEIKKDRLMEMKTSLARTSWARTYTLHIQ